MPLQRSDTAICFSNFYRKHFSDNRKRVFVFGINPGRFGAGITSIPFTDPYELEVACGIANPGPKKRELSAMFVYQVIDMLGGPKNFYRDFFLSAVCPIGFVRNNRNWNYYDDPKGIALLTPFITDKMWEQLQIGARRDTAIVLGKKNAKIFGALNENCAWFENLIALEHPRYIMQYKRKQVDKYLAEYQLAFQTAI